MSERLFTLRRRRSRRGAEREPRPGVHSEPDVDILLSAADVLSRRGVFGLVWLDGDLVARHAYGPLSEIAPLGRSVCESVSALTGLEDEILALRRRADRVLELPNITMQIGRGETRTPRLNLTVLWDFRRQSFLLLLARAATRSDLEIELNQKIRATRLYEEALVEQAKAVVQTNEELARANADLAGFAEIVTHDLSSPMRAMRYLADDLEQALVDPAAGDARQHIQRMRGQSRRMTSMLRSLLQYARIGRKAEALEEVDTRSLVEEIVGSLPQPAGLAIEIAGDWPRVELLKAPFDLVLRNLIDNAIRHAGFARTTPGGRISVTATAKSDGLTVSVADDGPGIAPELQEAIFKPFTSFVAPAAPDGEAAAGGSGMGLAMVRRALASAGAHIDVISNPQTAPGTTFNVHWPTGRGRLRPE